MVYVRTHFASTWLNKHASSARTTLRSHKISKNAFWWIQTVWSSQKQPVCFVTIITTSAMISASPFLQIVFLRPQLVPVYNAKEIITCSLMHVFLSITPFPFAGSIVKSLISLFVFNVSLDTWFPWEDVYKLCHFVLWCFPMEIASHVWMGTDWPITLVFRLKETRLIQTAPTWPTGRV